MLSRQRGTTLLEALIALFVVAFGLLAMAGLQIRTLSETRNSAARNTAAQMASDLLDRMLLNVELFATGEPAALYVTNWDTTPNAPVNCQTRPCTSSELAQFDLWQWKRAVAQLLPEGDAMVFRSATDTNQYGVLFRWRRLTARQESTASAALQTLFAAADEVKDGLGQSGAGQAGVSCPAGYICHLSFLRP